MKSSTNAAPGSKPWVAIVALVAIVFLFAGPHGAARALTSDSKGDVLVFGGQHVVIQKDQEVSGDLVVFGGSADVRGTVDGDAVTMGGKIYIAPEGRVNGSLVNVGGTIDNQSNAPAHGGAAPPPTAMPTPQPDMGSEMPMPVTPWYRSDWGGFFFFDALLAFLTFLLFPMRTRIAMDHLSDNPVLSGMLGFFSPIIFVLVIIALAITLVGIPLMPLAVLATIAGYLLGKAAIAQFIGTRLLDVFKVAQPKTAGAVALGLGVLFVLSAATGWLGIVFYFCVAALAVGTSLYMLTRTAQTYRRPSFPPAAPTFSPPVDPTHAGPPANQ